MTLVEILTLGADHTEEHFEKHETCFTLVFRWLPQAPFF